MSLRPDDKDRFASCKRSHKCCIQSQARCKGFVEHSHWYQRIKFCSAKFKNFTWINVFFKAMETSLPNTYGRRIFIFYFSKRNGILLKHGNYIQRADRNIFNYRRRNKQNILPMLKSEQVQIETLGQWLLGLMTEASIAKCKESQMCIQYHAICTGHCKA